MILVTGGTGLVGSHLLYELSKTQSKIRAIYRSKKKIKAVKHVFSYYTDSPDELFSKIEWIESDITDIPSLNKAFQDVTRVYHCAAFISFDTRDYHALRRINIEGTANVVNQCITFNVEKLCYVSSIATTGTAENKDELITEETHWNPEEDHNVYAITKYGAEMEVWRGTQEGLNAVVVNPGVIIGPGFWKSGSGSLIRFVYKGVSRYTNGSVGCVDIFDVIKPMILLMNNSVVNQRYILVSENLTYKVFFTEIANNLNVNPPTKLATKQMLNLAWRLDWLRANLFNKRRRLTKHTVKSITTVSNYSSQKLKDKLSYRFKPINNSISEVCHLFLKDLSF